MDGHKYREILNPLVYLLFVLILIFIIKKKKERKKVSNLHNLRLIKQNKNSYGVKDVFEIYFLNI